MFNPFLIGYFVLLAVFAIVSLIIVYHLWIYRINPKVAGATVLIFLAGTTILVFLNVAFALKINWSEYSLVL